MASVKILQYSYNDEPKCTEKILLPSSFLFCIFLICQTSYFRKQNAFASRSVAVHVQWWGIPQKAQSGNCFLGNVFEMLLMPQTTVCGLTRVSNCHFLSCPPLSPSSLHHTQENTNSNGTLASEFNPIFHCTANFKTNERVEINTSRRWKGQKIYF